jgi:uncharacterized protein (DUF1697 family)
MSAKVALLRGVNVSGKARLPMADFRALLADLGLRRVQTYIQSGNAVFDSDLPAATLEPMIRDAIAARFGFAPEVFVLAAGDITEALTDHPFALADPARVHVFFLKRAPTPDEDALRALSLPGDGWHLGARRFTLHAPAGIGRSRLADRLATLLPAPMTARNLRTLAALQAMLAERA